MNARLAEINARKQEIRELLKGTDNIDLDKLQKEIDDLDKEAREIQRREEMAAKINIAPTSSTVRKKPKPEEKPPEKRNKYDSEEYRSAFMAYVTGGAAIPPEFRADETTATSDVGALVPPQTLNQLIEKIEAWGMIIPLVNRTSYKTGMIIPTASIKPVATWTAEGSGSPKQKKALDASITFGHFKLRCAVAVTLETEYMAYSAFETALLNNLTEAMGRAIEKAILTGTGTGQPTGILTDTTKGVTNAVTEINYQTLINAEAALPMEYESGAVWVMTKKTFMQFYGMTDKNGQPIANVTRGITAVPERTLLGRKVVLTNYVNNYAETLEADKVFAFLYDFRDYTLNTNFQIGVKTYEDNDNDDIIRKSILICDGKPIIYDSLVKLTRGE